MEAGLRFPIPSFLESILIHYQLALTQLTPNAVQEILAFVALCFMKGQQAEIDVFNHFYELRLFQGHYQVQKRDRTGLKLFKGAKSSHGNWKKEFFFMRSGSSALPFTHSTIWTTYSSPKDYEITPQTGKAAAELVSNCSLPLDVMAITSPELLIFASLYPYSLRVGRFFPIS